MDPRESSAPAEGDPLAPAQAAPSRGGLFSLLRFLHVEAISGIVLLLGTVIALILANSIWADGFSRLWETRIGLSVGELELYKPLLLWVNDGLMTVFFFVVGLEIKRELVAGELRDPRKAALPVMAALGGMVAPALIYFSLQQGEPGERGWGIPMATDIAFVVGFLALLGPRVPQGLKIVLLSLAIVDDIGSVLVIAVFYSTDISLGILGLAALGLVATLVLRWLGVRALGVYLVVGVAIWLGFLKSGVHPTVAGVLLGLLTPSRPLLTESAFQTTAASLLAQLHQEADHESVLTQLRTTLRNAESPLERLEAALHPWVAYLIMPLFALANAGVSIKLEALGHPIAFSVALGLALGKPLGIVLFCWMAVRIGLARLPTGVNWKILIGGGCLAGIGFTMSLFIAGLALQGPLLYAGKIGTLLGSLVSAILGLSLLFVFLPKQPHQPTNS